MLVWVDWKPAASAVLLFQQAGEHMLTLVTTSAVRVEGQWWSTERVIGPCFLLTP